MTLKLCTDVGPADWIARGGIPWQQLVGFGPAGFDAYARLRLLPDPVRPGQSENDVEADGWRTTQLPRLFGVLAAHTTAADDCYVCIWDGWGYAEPTIDSDAVDVTTAPRDRRLNHRADARPGLAPEHNASPADSRVPRVVVPHRSYWLFRGPLTSIGTADAGWDRRGRRRLDEEQPAFVWPADHSWCFAQDIDPHWAGIGGSALLTDQLITDPRLDVVAADPTEQQPFYL